MPNVSVDLIAHYQPIKRQIKIFDFCIFSDIEETERTFLESDPENVL